MQRDLNVDLSQSARQLWPVVFLDRDGVINRMRDDYVKHWGEFELLPGALDAIARLSATGREVIVLTNQSAIGRKLTTWGAVIEIHSRLRLAVEEAGGHIRAVLTCPHHPAEGCSCRKPAPGLFLLARDDLGVELSRAVMVGDTLADVEAAWTAGCSAILVSADPCTLSSIPIGACPVAASLGEAVDQIVRRVTV